MRLSKQQHLDGAAPPKRILSLDGGGIRGVLTLEYLEVIETMLRQRRNDPSLLLSDYFDLIGGTSTGSIIAAGLACGMPVKEIKKLYTDLGAQVFVPTGFGLVAPKFQAGPLQAALDRALGADTSVDSDRIRTGLMIMTKRLDTGSPWPLNNGGHGRYAAQDGALRLTQVVRASTAAPTYFDPERIKISSRDGSVVDGNSSTAASRPSTIQRFSSSCWRRLTAMGSDGAPAAANCSSSRSARAAIRSSPQSQDLLGSPRSAGRRGAHLAYGRLLARVNLAMLQWLTKCLTPWRGRPRGRRHETRQPERTATRHLCSLQRSSRAGWLKTELGVDLGDKLAADPQDGRSLEHDGSRGSRPVGARRSRSSPNICRPASTLPTGDLKPRKRSATACSRRASPQGRAVQRSYDRRARSRQAAISARQGADCRSSDRRGSC